MVVWMEISCISLFLDHLNLQQLKGQKGKKAILDSKNGTLQHNAAFALYGLADNEDNVADLIKVGGVQKLLDGGNVGYFYAGNSGMCSEDFEELVGRVFTNC
ncbi:hypothetical protein LXL04_000044 [Taraxacum kok-saghyz]